MIFKIFFTAGLFCLIFIGVISLLQGSKTSDNAKIFLLLSLLSSFLVLIASALLIIWG